MELRTQVVLVAVVVGAACAASKPRSRDPAQTGAGGLLPSDAGAPHPRFDAGPRPPRVDAGPAPRPDAGAPDAGSPDAGAPDAGPPKPPVKPGSFPVAPDSSACPSGMILVDGDYCTEVENTCKKSWFDKSNKKTICEEFEPWTRCTGSKQKKRFCMDRYTYPNQKGARPEVMNRFHQAELKCAAFGKRLCTETEWTMACEGPRYLPYPYGYVRDANKCRGDQEWDSPDMKKVAKRDPDELARLWKGVPNGSQPECVSEYGVPDLPGNVDEVVASESFDLPGFKGKFDSVHTGGPWYKGVRNQCRPKIYTHDEAFYYYFLGFRCCAEPDGKPTDPRTPYQIKKNWKLERVERSAGITLEDLKVRLKDKAVGRCTCKAGDILCNTVCGTLLGPGARDAR
jgi:formylglycine-generating enzyme